MSKTIILGAPLTGKTTLTKNLREVVSIPVLDFDEELLKLNNGKYPANYPVLNEQLKNKVIETVSIMDQVMFFAFEINLDALRNMKRNGFQIVQLTAPYDVLNERNQKRLKNEADNDAFKYVETNLEYQKQARESGLVDIVIDTSSFATDAVADKILQLLN